MRNLRGTYVHRGDAARRRRRIKQALFAGWFNRADDSLSSASRKTATANAEPAYREPSVACSRVGETRKLRDELAVGEGELSLLRAQFERADKIIQYSTKYGIPAGMAGKVFDASLREGIDPELAFRLVRLESEFNARAVSKVGAIGLTQLMPSTAVHVREGRHAGAAVQSARPICGSGSGTSAPCSTCTRATCGWRCWPTIAVRMRSGATCGLESIPATATTAG